MDKLKSPIWLILSTALPYALLILFFYETYDVINSLLNEEQKQIWFNYGVYFGALAFIVLSYSVVLMFRRGSVGLWVSWLLLFLSIFNLTLFFAFIDEVLPFNIPSWMFTSSDLSIYPYTFIIPSALHALILLVLQYTPQPRSNNAWVNLGPIVLIPAIVSAAAFLMGSFGTRSTDLWILKYLPTYILVFFTCLLVAFVIRFLYILSVKSKKRDTLTLILKVLFTIVFPVAGLVFNHVVFGFTEGLFGDFSHPLYYILAVLNGIVVSLPNPSTVRLRWLLFIARSILFSFILYFGAVFLPYLPLSILAILAVGLGFLMLSPLVVFVLQVTTLRQDMEFLSYTTPKIVVRSVFIICLMVLPAMLTINYKLDRHQLDMVFSFLYERSFEDESRPEFNTERLTRLLDHIDDAKLRNSSHTPFLDSYYNWIVLDNLMLSDKKLDDISSVFMGKPYEESRHWRNWWSLPTRNATLDTVIVESSYNGEFWTSYAHLKVSTGSNDLTEFRTYIEVPPDCHVSNYYLDIEGKREYGILAEKRTANWVYNNIVNTRRDPGILDEIAENRYRLKVFPVTGSEPRTTGVEFIHKQPIRVTIGGRVIPLGEEHGQQETATAFEIMDGQALFIPEKAKKELNRTVRSPEYHIIIDRSNTSSWDEASLDEVMDKLNQSLGDNGTVRYWAGNYNFEELDGETWEKDAMSVEKEGGFYPEFLMKRELRKNWKNHGGSCPVFVMLVSNFTKVSILEGFSDFMFTSPDMNCFFTAGPDGNIQKFDLESAEIATEFTSSLIAPEPTHQLNWNGSNWFLNTDDEAEILFDSLASEPHNKWELALALQSDLRTLALYPQRENGWLNAVRSSISSGILTPLTSYISLENEAQKKALLHKQKEVLNSDANFDLEETEPMSEPSIVWYLAIVFFLWLWSYRRKLNQISG
ncbi:MAG: MSEP-CTERM sorting domain-containing protein [Flavobacteriales bacterium]|nr:MSEP-CTERM sorting domain-containing protein [Flavobacteriales bacterium]